MTQYDNTNKGALFANDNRKTDKHPTHTGAINVDGKDYWLSAWVRESKTGKRFFSLAVQPKEETIGKRERPTAQPSEEFDDSIPF